MGEGKGREGMWEGWCWLYGFGSEAIAQGGRERVWAWRWGWMGGRMSSAHIYDTRDSLHGKRHDETTVLNAN